MLVSMSSPRQASGRVLRVDLAGALIRTASGAVRATWGGALLAAIGADPDAAPRVGDVVDYVRWPDGAVTVERIHPRERRCG